MKVVKAISFRQAQGALDLEMSHAQVVRTETWQGRSTAGKPEMATREVEDVVIEVPIGTEDLTYHRQNIGPNLPWADEHFELDRVCGEPRNPGQTWMRWPYANKANTFRDPNGQFNHSYAERYWPKFAGLRTDNDGVPHEDERKHAIGDLSGDVRWPLSGIRYDYGDLNDLVDLLVRTPLTRAAYLPVFFPEDTGVVHGDRVPCTLGYLFRMRDGRLHVHYSIRSCDLTRHYADDVYLTVRLLIWVLQRCREKDPATWESVRPGRFMMTIGSLHMFVNDWNQRYGRNG